MALLPSIVSYSSNIADLFTKSIPRHRHTRLFIGIGVAPTATPLSASAHFGSAVDLVTTASAAVASAAPLSDSVPAAPSLPIVLDAGASLARPSDLSFEVTQASYGLIRSPILVVSKALASSTPVDPHTLITGEDVAFDLSSLDTAVNSTSDSDSDLSSFTKVTFDVRDFGTATLTFIYSKSTSELLHVFVDPTQIDWVHWIPLPRLILPESYFHVFGLDYLQAFTLFHLIPIWICCLLHFVVNLED